MKLDSWTGGQGGGTGSKFVSCLSKKKYDLQKLMAKRPDTRTDSVSLNLPVFIFQF